MQWREEPAVTVST